MPPLSSSRSEGSPNGARLSLADPPRRVLQTDDQKRVGSLSLSSSEIQIISLSLCRCRLCASYHMLNKVVFPKPAGAVTSVSFTCKLSLSRSSNFPRESILLIRAESGGGANFVARSGDIERGLR